MRRKRKKAKGRKDKRKEEMILRKSVQEIIILPNFLIP
jgi:hypothetical protein